MVVDTNSTSPTKKQKTVPLGKNDATESQSLEEPGILRKSDEERDINRRMLRCIFFILFFYITIYYSLFRDLF
jgi:hypothetical protein